MYVWLLVIPQSPIPDTQLCFSQKRKCIISYFEGTNDLISFKIKKSFQIYFMLVL